MHTLSVVILTHNEETKIAACIESAKQVSDDIIIIDAGSSDHTISICLALGARCYLLGWKGFGFARNFGAEQAMNNWILALDADETISAQLADRINKERLDASFIYKFRRENFLGPVKLRFGAWGFDTVKRIYNRQVAKWNFAIVHEKLVLAPPAKYKFIRGTVVHHGFKDFDECKNRMTRYAQLSAEKYFLEGRKSNLLKKIGSPIFNSFKSYFFQLGFLDGWRGIRLAYIIAYYSWLKYYYLDQIDVKSGYDNSSKTTIEVAPNRSFS